MPVAAVATQAPTIPPGFTATGGGPQPDYTGPLFGPRSELTPRPPIAPEDQARFDAAVARANKSKHKGQRG